jgi:mannose-6-phosphate isomerase
MNEKQDTIFKINGVIKNYDWGGTRFIADWLNIPNGPNMAMAEYWLGTHAQGMSIINEHATLLQQTAKPLSYLLKILDVRKMLSLQVHPTIAQATEGYAREDAAGIALQATNRNYKDLMHKPELMVALSPFWLLHGFKEATLLKELAEKFTSLTPLVTIYTTQGINAFLQALLYADYNMLKTWLHSVDDYLDNNRNVPLHKNDNLYWYVEALDDYVTDDNIDSGMILLFFMNVVSLQTGEAIFQDAGILHAYLEGKNIEIMANSDNVIRGGLTPKHVDKKELLHIVSKEHTIPNIIKTTATKGISVYPVPVQDFALMKFEPSIATQTLAVTDNAMVLIYEGSINVALQQYNAGEVLFIKNKQHIEIQSRAKDTILYIASGN